ncbi:glycosyltransferase [Arenibacter certesii]|uniref:Glycosyltransferase family 1 protein n=1 Tax=Arenibacter certesii TaxID=228955 RepID=A0A918IZA2_9FLAO|nr:glycosyltransferase [Arenibacter certesii]GGW38960.1 hypothetical protein GCM10007383_24670 [Arenibacter certesii]
MNLIIIPFHDWRKSQSEGFRTRDVHFIKSLSTSDTVEKILVINRPSTWLELLYKRSNKKIKGKIVLSKGRFILTKVDKNIYIADYHSSDVLGQIKDKHLWFIERYNDLAYKNFIYTCCKKLNINDYNLIIQNVFSYKLGVSLFAKHKLFDAWDNFLKFPAYKQIRANLREGYKELSKNIPLWITNSEENISFYTSEFNVKSIHLMKNGVKVDFLANSNISPKDLKNIPKPIIGFGGKISYLLDYNLINYLTEDNPSSSFVFVGQILDKEVYKKIIKRSNVFFLGDKNYSIYPNYVMNFDICIVPYNINEGQHGGDSMKAYEYLLTGKKVVGTIGNGLQDLEEYIYLAQDQQEFSNALKNVTNDKPRINIKNHSWESKSIELLNILEK